MNENLKLFSQTNAKKTAPLRVTLSVNNYHFLVWNIIPDTYCMYWLPADIPVGWEEIIGFQEFCEITIKPQQAISDKSENTNTEKIIVNL